MSFWAVHISPQQDTYGMFIRLLSPGSGDVSAMNDTGWWSEEMALNFNNLLQFGLYVVTRLLVQAF